MTRSLIALAVTAFLLCAAGLMAFFLMTDTEPLSKGEFLREYLRLKAYKYTGAVELEQDDRRTLYEWSCVNRCHGAGPVERARHTRREWDAIVRRMDENGAGINLREREAIAAHLQKNYGSNVPTILSPAADRYLKRFLWKSDFGESDLFVDVIYAPKEYFELTGEQSEMKKYGAEKNIVFKVFMNTHQGRLENFALRDLAALQYDGARRRPVEWRPLFSSTDMHHLEGVLIFEPVGRMDRGALEVVLTDLPGQKERVFRWELPLPEMAESLR